MKAEISAFPNLRHLRLFRLIAEGESIRGAAKLLRVSQPAATVRISALEKHYGKTLLLRGAHGATVTEFGRILHGRILRCIGYLQVAMEAASDGETQSGEIERRLHQLTVTQMRALVALHRYRGFAAAASFLDIKPPSVHRSISELEAILGNQLVIRSPRHAVTNDLGARVARPFGLALNELALAHEEIQSHDGEGSICIHLGATRGASDFLPDFILQHTRQHAFTPFHIEQSQHDEMLEWLRSGDIDLVFSTNCLNVTEDLLATKLLSSELKIICREGHPLAGKPDVPAARLCHYPWAIGMDPDSAAAETWRSLFEAEGLPCPKPFLRTRVWEVLRGVLLSSDCLYLARPSHQRGAMDGLVTIDRQIPSATRHLWFIRRRNWRPTAAHVAFSAMIEQTAEIELGGLPDPIVPVDVSNRTRPVGVQ